MSRRINPGPDRAEQNRATLKSLVKLEHNKSCADCKRNKHPRWASWNLGIFICIRCSGIHRGMGTHISRVKSVDLDSWTDEQLASMLKWGNAKANKYWEAKLAPGHVPSESKIENFIRTKYDSKRWVMDGGMPDPSTLGGEEDDNVPLNVVQEKAKMERSASIRNSTSIVPPPKSTANIDLFGDVPTPTQARPSTTEPAVAARPPPPTAQAPAAPSKQTKPGDSLLGLDFFGSAPSAAPARPASVTSGVTSPGIPQRSDLKQSILSLYASAPRAAAPQPQVQPQQPRASSAGFGDLSGMSSPASSSAGAFGGMNDAFSGLSFSSAPQQPKPAPFSGLTSPAGNRSSISSLSGGSFFDSKPAPIAKTTPPPPPKPHHQSMSGFGDFGAFASAAPAAAKSPPPAASSMGDLFDLTGSAPAPAPVSKSPAPVSASSYSAFNLSKSTPAPAPAASSIALNNFDAWGSNDAWGATQSAAPAAPAPKQASTTTAPSYKAPATTSLADDFGGWGSNEGTGATAAPVVTQDDDFGGWNSASPVAARAAPAGGAAAPSGSDDLFGNVWG